MEAFNIIALLTTLAAVFAWVNHRFVKLPITIGLMVISLAFSVGLVVLTRLDVLAAEPFVRVLEQIRFDEAVLQGMLGALLFAGALHVHLDDLRRQKILIGTLATLGVVTSTVLVGFGSQWLFGFVGVELPLVYALLFGALISPTDPIAVAAILKKAGVPKELETSISGESLFNDGVGVVVFLGILGVATSGHAVAAGEILHLLTVEVGGGVLFGGVMGYTVYRMLRSVENYQVEILLTVAIVTGGYVFAQQLHVSGPLAMVVAGLLIGNRGRALAMSDLTVRRLDEFWELIDEFLNAILFVMIGIEVLVMDWTPRLELAGLIAIPLVLLVRFISVGGPALALKRVTEVPDHAVRMLTWGGLRGAISVALALSLPAGPERDAILTITYIVVIFSILVQGLTVGKLAKRLTGGAREEVGAGHH